MTKTPKRWTLYGWVPKRDLKTFLLHWEHLDAAPIFKERTCRNDVRVRISVTRSPLTRKPRRG